MTEADAVRASPHSLGRRQSLAVEEFFYFFLRLRKNEVRRNVSDLALRFPDDDPRRRAHRLIDAKTGLAAIGGGLLHLSGVFPTLDEALKVAGMVGAGSLVARMHLYLILEIACVYGEDIDDLARVPEMVAVVAASGLGAAAPSLLPLGPSPLLRAAAGALSTVAVTRLIGWSAIRFYGGRAAAPEAGEPA